MKNSAQLAKISLLFLVLNALLLSSCGSSGGSGGFFAGAGFVTVDASPKRVDTGNRMQLRSEIGDTHPDGVALKVRYPRSLSYVLETAELSVDGAKKMVFPAVDIDTGSEMFLVFFFKQSEFGKNNYGQLTFELRANSALSSGRIEVDLDVDDIFVDNRVEFDPSNPEFTAIDSVGITIID